MSIILNERDWVEKVFVSRELGKAPVETLARVARYYHHVGGCTRGEILERLEVFLLQCDPDVVLVKWADILERVSKQAGRYELIELSGVVVSAEELADIKALDGVQTQRLAFTLLCISKYWNSVRETNGGWVNTPDREIMRMANINTSIRRQSLMFHNLRGQKLIRFGRRVDSLSIQVLFGRAGEAALEIADFRNLGNQYMAALGGRYMQCSHCGITIKKNSNSHRFCGSCVGVAG